MNNCKLGSKFMTFITSFNVSKIKIAIAYFHVDFQLVCSATSHVQICQKAPYICKIHAKM